jgi:hypothetical protein
MKLSKETTVSVIMVTLVVVLFAGLVGVETVNADEHSLHKERLQRLTDIPKIFPARTEEVGTSSPSMKIFPHSEFGRPTPADHQVKSNDRIKELRSKLQQKRESVAEKRDVLRGERKERAARAIQNISDHLQKAVDRLNNIAARIEVRLEILAERGLDTEDAESALETAYEKIDEAAIEVDALVNLFSDGIDDDTAKEDIRELMESTKSALKEAKVSLTEVVKVLKESNKDSS